MAQAFIKIELKEGKVEMNMEGMTGELADLLIGALGRVIAGCSPEVRGDLLEDVTAAIPKAVKVALMMDDPATASRTRSVMRQ